MAQKQYTENDLSNLIAEVEKEFNAHLEKVEEQFNAPLAKSEETAPLAKAEEKKDESPKADEKHESKEEHEEKKDEAPKADAKPEEKPAEEHGEHKEEHKEDEAHGYDQEDLEHMHKMYLSMSKAELKAHHDSVRKALDSHGMEKCGDMHMAKSEETSVTINTEVVKPSQEVELLKSEVQAEKVKYEELKKTYDTVAAILTKLVAKKAAPEAKAITSLDVIAKSESIEGNKELSKKEVDGILVKKSADPTLKKSDRDAINAFYLNGASINTISHLLK